LSDNFNDLFINENEGITLIRKVKPQSLIKRFFTKWPLEPYEVKIGKISMKDQLAAQKKKFDLAPEKTKANLLFLAWLINRLIKKVNKDWNVSDEKLLSMMTEETIRQVNKIILDAMPDVKKKQLKGVL